jgi:hypothetical protein
MLPEHAVVDASGKGDAAATSWKEGPTMAENLKAVLADRIEISWDTKKNKWLVRIQSGEEVIRRHCGLPKGADDPALRSAAEKVVQDEGFEPDLTRMTIRR